MQHKFLFGKNALLDAINNHLPIDIVYLLENNTNLINLLKTNKINFQIKNKHFFNELNISKEHQGIVFNLKINNKPIEINQLISDLASKEKSLILILDEIQDVGNFGAILRSADAFNVDAIIYKKNNQADPFNDVVVKTSTNAVSYLTLCEVANLSNVIEKLKNIGYWVYASALDKNATSYNKIDFANKSVFIVGNEQKGVSPLVIKNSDITMYIPQYGHVQSLNVSVATGILLAQYWNKK